MFLQFTPAYGFAFLQSGILPRAVFHKPPGRKTRCGKRTQTVVFHTVFAPQARRGSYPFRLAASRQATFPKGTAFGGGGKVSGIAQRRPLGGAGAQRLRGYLPELPQSRYARQIPFFVAARHLLPAGRSRALRWGLWHGGKASGSSAKLAGAPEAPSQRELAKPIGFD